MGLQMYGFVFVFKSTGYGASNWNEHPRITSTCCIFILDNNCMCIACAFASACACACTCVCVRACVRVCVCENYYHCIRMAVKFNVFVWLGYIMTHQNTSWHRWGLDCTPWGNVRSYIQYTVIGWDYVTWASYQIRKIAGCTCAGDTGNVFPATDFKGNPLVSDPGMHHGSFVTHVPWCMSGSLTRCGRENVPSIAGECMHNLQFYVSGKRPVGVYLWVVC